MKNTFHRSFVKARALTLGYACRPTVLAPVRVLSPADTPCIRLQSSSSSSKGDLESKSSTRWSPHSIDSFKFFPQPPAQKSYVKAYIAFGGNLGDRVGWIEKACNEMSAQGIIILRTSSLWETDPMYVLEQDKFLNGVCEVHTTLEPLELLDTLQQIERDLGREKIIDKGPRNIDLDILLYGDKKVDHERLIIPHIGITEREFVLRPLAELIPSHPIDASSPWKTIQDHLNALPLSEPLTTVTPLGRSEEPIRALQTDRKTRVMAIINLTPDSFSDGGQNAKLTGKELSLEAIRATIEFATKRGATILDCGGASSAPESADITDQEEILRVVPFIEQIRKMPAGDNVLISVDTYRVSVAEAAVKAGADIINDISAGTLDRNMLPTMARLGKTVCLMHMRGTPNTMQKSKMRDYSPDGLIATIAKELLQRISAAEAAGIRRWRIILDPGIGFAKDGDQNLEILRRLNELRDWPGLRGLPWLIGSSRKRFIGKIIGEDRADQRQYGTAATVAAAVQGGADIVRVHDVRQMAQVAKMSDAIWRV